MSKTICVNCKILKKPLHDNLVTTNTLASLRIPFTDNNWKAFQKCMRFMYSVEDTQKYFKVQMGNKKDMPLLQIPLLDLAYKASLSRVGYREDLVEELKAWSYVSDVIIYNPINPFEKEYLEELFLNTPGVTISDDTACHKADSIDFTVNGTIYVGSDICDKDVPKNRVDMEKFIEEFMWGNYCSI